MSEILKIVCPVCGTVLSVNDMPGIEKKNVTCPVCKKKSPFVSFKRVGQKPLVNPYASGGAAGQDTTCFGNPDNQGSSTKFIDNANYTVGQLHIKEGNVVIRLKLGRNVIGRRAPGSNVDIQLPCPTNSRTSREHLVIEVKKVPAKGFVHYVSLYKEKVNKTSVNGMELMYGDTIVLNHGDKIQFPDVEVAFEIPGGSATDF